MKISRRFIRHIEKNCTANPIDGLFHCKKCGYPVDIDWFEHIAECLGCDDL